MLRVIKDVYVARYTEFLRKQYDQAKKVLQEHHQEEQKTRQGLFNAYMHTLQEHFAQLNKVLQKYYDARVALFKKESDKQNQLTLKRERKTVRERSASTQSITRKTHKNPGTVSAVQLASAVFEEKEAIIQYEHKRSIQWKYSRLIQIG
jgi:hypothetical protein